MRKIKELTQRIESLEEQIWILRNPPKFKVGDPVIIKELKKEGCITSCGEFYIDPWGVSFYSDSKGVMTYKYEVKRKGLDTAFYYSQYELMSI